MPGTVSGTHITADTFVAGPINVTVSGYALKLYNVTAHLEGDATSINPLDTSGDFGPRVYGITGDPTGGADGTSYVDIGSVKLGLLNLGAATVDIYSWDANRSATAAPCSPGTLALLLGMGVSLAGFSWRKRRISRADAAVASFSASNPAGIYQQTGKAEKSRPVVQEERLPQ